VLNRVQYVETNEGHVPSGSELTLRRLVISLRRLCCTSVRDSRLFKSIQYKATSKYRETKSGFQDSFIF
jgi:hypothetical protein